jgi:putative ABC transport system permease protein
MSFFEIVRVALQSIRGTKLRSFLTALGIVIGVAAVITMVGLGSGARAAVEAQLDALGTDLLSITAGQSYWRGVASGENFPEVQHFTLAEGRFFTAGEDYGRRRVAVVGHDILREFDMEGGSLVGKEILIRGIAFEVVGQFAPKGDQPGRDDPDETVYIPFRTGEYRIFGTDRLRGITVQLTEPGAMDAALLDIEQVLRREHRLRPDERNDFRIRDRSEFLTARAEASATLTYLLAGIAAVSLMVGGIGIMNIMLVSVTERTREIGVRKALGATRHNVMLQFLVEALTLCFLGGVVGIALGAGASAALARLNGWSTLISPAAIALAVGFSIGVGLFFGVWPARRAARLDPIQALRYE